MRDRVLRPEALGFLRRYVAYAVADGIVDEDEIATFHRYVRMLGLASADVAPVWNELQRGKVLGDVRRGRLPKMNPTGVYLELDESCHLNVPGTYVYRLQYSDDVHSGRLVMTNKRFLFLGQSRSHELTWKKILSLNIDSGNSIQVNASQKKGSGPYVVEDPEYVTEVASAIARIDRRQVLAPGQRDTARVSREVKAQVWQRDGGMCVECQSNSYLEFDHVIARSKGGATSVNNLQLLCRGCNMRKGANL